jgi:glutathione S-transferase
MMADMPSTTLYAVPASHPCAVVERALQMKGMAVKRVDLIPMTHPPVMRLRFGARTVPGVIFEDGKKLQGSRAIVRELDRRVPEPRLVGDDARVAAVEEWGDEVLQPLVRRLLWASLRRSPKAMTSYAKGAKLPIPVALAALGAAPVAALEGRLNRASDANVRADLANLHEHLDRADRWIEEGLLGGEHISAADLQVSSGVRLLLTLGDLQDALARHPVAELARRVFPHYPGATPAGALPPEWLSALA